MYVVLGIHHRLAVLAHLEMETTAAYRHCLYRYQLYYLQWANTLVKFYYLAVCLVIVEPIVVLHNAIAS